MSGDPHDEPPRPGGEPFVGPRDWPPAEMRWPPPPGSERPRAAPLLRAPIVQVALALLVAVPAIVALQALALDALARASGRAVETAADRRAFVLEAPLGPYAAVLPQQLGFALAALAIAWLAAEPVRERLALGRPRAGLALALAIAVGTLPAYAAARWIATVPFDATSGQLELLEQLVGSVPRPVAIALFAVVPGVCEELFFRGLVQRGLARALPPAAAVAVAALCFGAVHGDLQQGTFAAALGLWLGWVTWRTGSIWPAAACHAFANALGIALGVGGSLGDGGAAG